MVDGWCGVPMCRIGPAEGYFKMSGISDKLPEILFFFIPGKGGTTRNTLPIREAPSWHDSYSIFNSSPRNMTRSARIFCSFVLVLPMKAMGRMSLTCLWRT